MKSLVFCLAFAALAVVSLASPFTNCGSPTGAVETVGVEGCADSDQVCILKKGTSANITIHFTSKSESKTLTAVAHGIIAGVPIPFQLPEPDACKKGVSCPISSGKNYGYSDVLDIKRSYPAISVTVKWELKDSNSADVVCVEIPCRIQ